jgi:hypothetical protein
MVTSLIKAINKFQFRVLEVNLGAESKIKAKDMKGKGIVQ